MRTRRGNRKRARHAPDPSSQASSSRDADTGMVKTRNWLDVPTELLPLISDRLGLIDLLSFRAVCKVWRSTSSASSASTDSGQNFKPWFIIHERETSQCTLFDPELRRFTINVPEMQGATCIASNQGWLLFLQTGHVFFLCPFSHAKIDLPSLPHSENYQHVAAFSSPPTCQDCIVCVISRSNDDNTPLDVNVLRRGATAWSTHKCKYTPQIIGSITSGAYHDGTFYYLAAPDKLLTFPVEEESWQGQGYKSEGLVAMGSTAPLPPFALRLPFFQEKDHLRAKEQFGLDDNDSISICGTLVHEGGFRTLFGNQCVNAPEGSERRRMQGIWVHTRLFRLPPNYSW